MDKFGIILFHTNSSAMQAEALLANAKLVIKLVPTPRDLSSDCGVSLRFDWSLVEEVRNLLEKSRVDFAGIHPLPAKK
jgi:Putative Se/S carrier protein-like